MKFHLDGPNWSAKCGLGRTVMLLVDVDNGGRRTQDVAPFQRTNILPLEKWRSLPPQAQCSKCARAMPTRLHATEEHVTAVEVALHAIASVWA